MLLEFVLLGDLNNLQKGKSSFILQDCRYMALKESMLKLKILNKIKYAYTK